MKSVNLYAGDCLVTLKNMPDSSIDSIVTDPPYGLSFMGKAWDYEVPSEEIWREAFRVLKPGGHLLSFFGTRTYHRGVVRIEDAGFEIRDQIMWIYGSGFPKSTDVSKRIDKEAGAEPSTDEAKQWQGWGSALKPANEPICVARKPLEKGLTLAQNVLKWGCGGINIDESRIGVSAEDQAVLDAAVKRMTGNKTQTPADRQFLAGTKEIKPVSAQGRWPANILFDEAAAELLDVQQADVSRFFYVAKASKSERNAGLERMPEKLKLTQMRSADGTGNKNFEGGFQDSMQQNTHPTVKPIKLMQYLIKLVTPPNGTILDPFMGSGSTGVAANNLGFNFIGCEMNEEYMQIATKRIQGDDEQ